MNAFNYASLTICYRKLASLNHAYREQAAQNNELFTY